MKSSSDDVTLKQRSAILSVMAKWGDVEVDDVPPKQISMYENMMSKYVDPEIEQNKVETSNCYVYFG